MDLGIFRGDFKFFILSLKARSTVRKGAAFQTFLTEETNALNVAKKIWKQTTNRRTPKLTDSKLANYYLHSLSLS